MAWASPREQASAAELHQVQQGSSCVLAVSISAYCRITESVLVSRTGLMPADWDRLVHRRVHAVAIRSLHIGAAEDVLAELDPANLCQRLEDGLMLDVEFSQHVVQLSGPGEGATSLLLSLAPDPSKPGDRVSVTADSAHQLQCSKHAKYTAHCTCLLDLMKAVKASAERDDPASENAADVFELLESYRLRDGSVYVPPHTSSRVPRTRTVRTDEVPPGLISRRAGLHTGKSHLSANILPHS